MSTNRMTQHGKALDDIANGAVDPFEVLSRDDIRVLVRHFLEGMLQVGGMLHESADDAAWIKWTDPDGYGAMPVAVDDVIAYRMRDGHVLCTDYPAQLEWCQPGKRSDIVEYRLLTIEESKDMAPWVEWVGGDCPIDPAAVVQIRMHENGRNDAGIAGLERWKHWPSSHADYDANIVAYRLIEAPKPELRAVTTTVHPAPAKSAEGKMVGRATRPTQPACGNDWVKWTDPVGNGSLPEGVAADDAIAYRMKDGSVLTTDYPHCLNWIHEGEPGDIVEYRLLTVEEVADMAPWVEWTGGECPVDPASVVQVRLFNYGQNEAVSAGMQNWQHLPKTHHSYDINIVAYRVVRPIDIS